MNLSACKYTAAVKAAMIVGAITFLVYIPALFADFVNFDDPHAIYANPAIRVLDLQFIKEALTTSFFGWWMPLIWISLAIDYHFWGLNPFGYHLTNNILHAVNAGLVVVVADILYQRILAKKVIEENVRLYFLLLISAGLLFGIHPVHVESVAWAIERKNVLSTFFSLAALICYLRYVASTGVNGERKIISANYLLSIAFLCFSLMTKPVGVAIPVLMLIADFYPFNRINRGAILKVILEKAPHLLLALATAVVTVLLASGQNALVSLAQFSLADRFILSGYAVFEYCRLMLAPFGIIVLNLIPDPLPLAYLIKALLVAAFSITALFMAKKRPWIAATWFCFLVSLLPSLHFFINGANRYSLHFLYLPAIIPSIAAGAAVFRLYTEKSYLRSRSVTLVIAGALTALFCAFIVMTQIEIRSWRDSEALWTRVIKHQPVGRAYYYRALHFMDKGNFNAAAADYRESIRMGYEAGHPEVYTLHAFRGEALRQAGRYEEAVRELSAAIDISPLPNFYYYRSLALRSLGNNTEADDDLKRSGGDNGPIVWQFLQNSDDSEPKREK